MQLRLTRFRTRISACLLACIEAGRVIACFPAGVIRTAGAPACIITGAVAGLAGLFAGKACRSTCFACYMVCLAGIARVSRCCRLQWSAEFTSNSHMIQGVSLLCRIGEPSFLCREEIHLVANLFHPEREQGCTG